MAVFRAVRVSSLKRRNFLHSMGLGATVASLSPIAASAAAPRKLRMVTSWPAGFPGLGTSASRVARRIEAATGEELSVQVFSAGERVGPFDVFDAVGSGEADLYHSADYYQATSHSGFNFFTAIPFGMTAVEMAAWLMHAGGQQLWDELAAPNNIKPLMCTNTGTQMGGWFNREIQTAADFENLKIRMPGLGGVALGKLGAEVNNIAGGEIHGALKDGRLDAAEWVGPWNDLAAGMHEVAKYYYYPGFHEPGGTLTLGINLDVWRSFDDRLRGLFEEVTAAEYTRSLTEFNYRNALALTALRDQHGVQLRAYSDEILRRVARLAGEAVAEVAADDAMTGIIHKSFVRARQDSMRWSAIGEEAFTTARRRFHEA